MSDKKTVRKKRRSLVMMSHSDCGGSYQKLLKDNPPSNPALTTLSMGPTPNNLVLLCLFFNFFSLFVLIFLSSFSFLFIKWF